MVVAGKEEVVEEDAPTPPAPAVPLLFALPRGTAMITGGGVVRRRSGTVGADERPLLSRAGGWLRGVVDVGPPTRGLGTPLPGRGDLFSVAPACTVAVAVPRGVTALRPLGSPAPPLLCRFSGGTMFACGGGLLVATLVPSDFDRLWSTGRLLAFGEALLASREGTHAASRRVKLAMADGTLPHRPALSGERPAGGEGEPRGEAAWLCGTLPAPAPYVAKGVESSLNGSHMTLDVKGARDSLSEARCRRDVLSVLCGITT